MEVSLGIPTKAPTTLFSVENNLESNVGSYNRRKGFMEFIWATVVSGLVTLALVGRPESSEEEVRFSHVWLVIFILYLVIKAVVEGGM